MRVGVAWQGRATSEADRGRSVPLAALAELARVPGVRLICLQKGDGLDQLAQLPEGLSVETLGTDFDAGPNAFIDTAAVMMSLDLVITVDTAIAHLAGALGRPVWILLKAIPHFVWLLEGENTPWYPTARLFRQTTQGDWGPVFERVFSELRQFVGERDGKG